MDRKLAVALLALLLLLQFAIHWEMRRAYFFSDEGYYLTYSWLTQQGQVIYRDFHDNHAPGIAMLGGALFFLFGPEFEAARLAVAFAQMGTTVAIFLLARKFYGARAALISAAFYAIAVPIIGGAWFVIEPFFTLFASFSALLLYEYAFAKKQNPTFALAAGLLAGCALAFKQPGALFILFGAAAVLLADGRKKDSARFAGLAWFIAGAAAIPLLLSVYFALNGALWQFIYDTVIFNIIVKGSRDAGVYVALEELLILFLLIWLGIMLVHQTMKQRKGARFMQNAFLLAWALSCAFLAFPRFNVFHLMASIPPLAIFLGSVIPQNFGRLFEEEKRFAADVLKVSTLLVFAGILAFASLSIYLASFEQNGVAPLETVADAVQSKAAPNDTIQAFPAFPEVYFFSKRLPATSYIAEDPWVANPEIDADMRRQLEAARPAVIIYSNFTSRDYPPPQDFLPLSDAYVRGNYSVYAEFTRLITQDRNVTLYLMERKAA